MPIYDKLIKYQKGRKNLFKKSEEVEFFNLHKQELLLIDQYKNFVNATDDFDIIRANIIIRALENKKKLDQIILYAFQRGALSTDEANEFIKERTIELPYFKEEEIKIFIPIFIRSINKFYSEEYGKLLSKPYSSLINDFSSSCIDPFDIYGFNIFDSLFSKMIAITKNDKLAAYYHYEFNTIYFINNQGRIESKVALFDKYIKHVDSGHIIERIRPVIDSYFSDDKEGFYQALVENKLVSKKLIGKIMYKRFNFLNSLIRKANRD